MWPSLAPVFAVSLLWPTPTSGAVFSFTVVLVAVVGVAWMNAKEAATYLGVCRRTIYWAANAGHLRVSRVGRRGDIRTCAKWCDEYVEANAPPPVRDNGPSAGTPGSVDQPRG